MSNLKPLSAKYLKTALIFVCGCIDMWEDCKQDNKQVQVKIHFYSLTQCENHSYPCSMPSWDFFLCTFARICSMIKSPWRLDFSLTGSIGRSERSELVTDCRQLIMKGADGKLRIPEFLISQTLFWYISILPHLFRKITDISPDFPVILGLRRNRETNREEGETL